MVNPAMQIPEYKQFLKFHLKEFKHKNQKVEQDTKRKAKLLESRRKMNKISERSYIEEIQVIKNYEKERKSELKKTKNNFIKMLGVMHNNLSFKNGEKYNPEESRVLNNSMSTFHVNESFDVNAEPQHTENQEKGDILESHIGKQTLTALDMSSLNISIMNSAAKDKSKISRTLHKVRENNMSIDSSRAVRPKVSKNEKHLYSIIPFDYKTKAQEVISPTQSLIISPNIVKSPEIQEQKVDPVENLDQKHTSELEISNNSIKIVEEHEIKEEVLKKEIVIETDQKEPEIDLKPITPRNCQEINNPAPEKDQNLSYESPEKEDWEIKLPSIKSSSGNDHLRNSELEQLDGNKENSIEIDPVNQSSEVAMFISSKELSPKNLSNSQNSHLRNRINSIRVPEDVKASQESDQVLRKAVEKLTEEPKPPLPTSVQQNNQNLVKEFELMKEPSLNPLDALRQNFSNPPKVVKKNLAEMNHHTEMITDVLYEYICREALENIEIPHRVDVESIREKYSEMTQMAADKSDSSESSDSDEPSQGASSSEPDSQANRLLKVQSSSGAVEQYVTQILDEIEASVITEVKQNITKPIRVNDLELLKGIRQCDYEVDFDPEFQTQPIVNIQLYLNKERSDKAEKEDDMKALLDSINRENADYDEKRREEVFSFICQNQHIHNKAIFDAINEAFDKHRPYGLKGCPPAWSDKTKTLTNNFLVKDEERKESKFNFLEAENSKVKSIKDVFSKVKEDIQDWTSCCVGTLAPSQTTSDNSADIKQLREDRL